jgi:hypothetical protein
MKIFDVDEKDRVIVSPEVKGIKWIRRIIEKDKGSPGDHDGRKKYLATKELLYVYHMCDIASIYSRLPENIRESEVIDSLDLPKGWRPDEIVKEACAKYSQYKETVSERTLKEIKRTLEASVDTIQFLREMIELKIKTIKETKDTTQLTELVDMFNNTLDMAKAIPKNVEEISKLEQKVKKEQMESEGTIRGGGDQNTFET